MDTWIVLRAQDIQVVVVDFVRSCSQVSKVGIVVSEGVIILSFPETILLLVGADP